MKIIKQLCFLLICFVSTPANSQTYLNESCNWKIQDYAFVDFLYFNSNYDDYINGDTLLDGLAYYKLYRSRTTISGPSPNDSMYINETDEYRGAIREENKVWYWINKDANNAEVLYDFNLQAGDSLIYPLNNNKYKLVLKDSIFHNGIYKKVYNLEGIIIDFIEGVGFINGTTFPIWPLESISYLQCFNKDGENLNPDLSEIETFLGDRFVDVEDCENIVLQDNEVNDLTQEITIFPNPFQDQINIHMELAIETINVFNLTGSLVHTIQGNVKSVSLNNLPAGAYLLQIKSKDNGLITKKLIKH